MKYLLFILFLILESCYQNSNSVVGKADTTSIVHLPRQLPDSLLVSQKHDRKVFQLNLKDHKIDFKKTALLQGEWSAIEGDISFLNTTLESGKKVIFKDNITKSFTGWGVLVYNRAAKFYFTESGSHVYEYYIDQDGLLNLIQLDYRSSDLSLKKEPEPVYELIEINWLANNEIELNKGAQRVKLRK